MDKIIKADLYRYGGLTGMKGLWKGLSYPGFRYTFLMRKAATSRPHTIKRKILVMLLSRYQYKYGFQISFDTEIGPGLFIGHFGTLGINSRAKVGKNLTIMFGVTIGQANRGKLKGFPVIGDNVWIGAHAVIVGNVNIGSNVLIAPNAYINFDVPAHAMVIGNPGKIVLKENPTSEYIMYTLDDNGEPIKEEVEF